MKKYIKISISVFLTTLAVIFCQMPTLADLVGGVQTATAFPGSGTGATNWVLDPGGNAPFYASGSLNTNNPPSGNNRFTGQGEQAPNVGNGAVASLLAETVTITNTSGVNYDGTTGGVLYTNYALTGISLLLSGGPDTHPYSIHIFDVTTNLSDVNVTASDETYNFSQNGDLFGNGLGGGVVFTNSFLGGALQQDYFGLTNGPAGNDLIVLGAGHTYAVEVWFPFGSATFYAQKTSGTVSFGLTTDAGGNLMAGTDTRLSASRQTGSAAGFYGGTVHNWLIALYGYPTNAPLTVNTSTNMLPPPPPAPVVAGIEKASPGLRLFAASTATTTSREELATADEGQSWINPTHYPVSYSFSLLSYPSSINQTHIFLIPKNTAGQANLGNGDGGNNNENIDYQASNSVWLVINPVSNGIVTASIGWKTNTPNSNPTITQVVLTNSTAIGTWALTFNNDNSGTVTAPGGNVQPFTIADPSIDTDFANPLIAYFGLQPNSAAGQGQYEDWGFISVSGVSGVNENEDFTKEPTGAPSSAWVVNSHDVNAAQGAVVVSTNEVPAYWVNWTLPAPNFNVGTRTNLVGGGDWINPAYYSNYQDENNPRGNASQFGLKEWALLPPDDLPTVDGNPGSLIAPTAFFIISTQVVSP
ncbi:MAG TPA: hypothetical protein VHG71_01670 [Verrucomicrobiae bacterium]|nr:hypothetical protein [Verrucomicrobiae bacterium]